MNDVKFMPHRMDGIPFNIRTMAPFPHNMPQRTTPLFQSELRRASRPPNMAPPPKTFEEKLKVALQKPWLTSSMARTRGLDVDDFVTDIYVANKLLPSFEEFSKECDKELEQILQKRPTASPFIKIHMTTKLEKLQEERNSNVVPPPPPPTVDCEASKRKKRVKVRPLGRVIGNLKRMHHALPSRLKAKLTRWNVELCFIPLHKLPENERLKYIEDLSETECDRVSLSSELSPGGSIEQDEASEVEKRLISQEGTDKTQAVPEPYENRSLNSLSKNYGSSNSIDNAEADNESVSNDMPQDARKATESNSAIIDVNTREDSLETEEAQGTVAHESVAYKIKDKTDKETTPCIEIDPSSEENDSSFEKSADEAGVNNETTYQETPQNSVEDQITGRVPEKRKARCTSGESSLSNDLRPPSIQGERDEKRSSSVESIASPVNKIRRLTSTSPETTKHPDDDRRSVTPTDDGKAPETNTNGDRSSSPSSPKESSKLKTTNDCDTYDPSLFDLAGRETPVVKMEATEEETEFYIPDFSDMDLSPRRNSIDLQEAHRNHLARANRPTQATTLKSIKYLP